MNFNELLLIILQSSLSEDGSAAVCPQFSPAGVKLGAMMEQLQRQQEAKLEMNLQEKHLLQAQLLFAQHAAAARAASSKLGPPLFGTAAQQALNNHLSRIDPDEEDEDSDEEDQETVDNDEMEEDEDEEENGLHQQVKKPRLQQVPGFPFPPYSMSQPPAVQQMSESPSSAIKREQEEKDLLSPVGQQAFPSPSDFSDWSCEEPFKQVRYL